jgi:hypothetical protein
MPVLAPVTTATRPLWSGMSTVVHLPFELMPEDDTHRKICLAVSVQSAITSVAFS